MRRAWLAVCALAVACGSRDDKPPAREGSTPTPAKDAQAQVRADHFDGNVLVILVDTVRADRLGVAGYRRNGKSITPRLDAFAETATRFTRAHAHGANTPRSLPSLLTSRMPSQIAFQKSFHNFPSLLDSNVLLFEVLSAAGLRTISESSHFYFDPRRGVGQGVTAYDNSGARTLVDGNLDYAAPRIVPRVLDGLERSAKRGERFAMLVHLFEPHSTYIEHPAFPIAAKGEAGLVEKYDAEIAVVDGWVGRILDALDQHHLADRTLVVVLSDHGEAFGVHRFRGERAFFHGQTLYEEILRVPLLVRLPGTRPSVRDELVGLVDVAPTIVDALGLPAPDSFVGRSLLPALRGEAVPPRPVLAEIQPTPDIDDSIRAFVTADGSEKIIVSEGGKHVETYDLARDPDELKDLSAAEPDRVARLRAALDRWTDNLR